MNSTPFDPLHTPEAPGWTPSLDVALEAARETLAEQQAANIYDDRAMLGAAVRLEIALRHLLDAYDAEAGR
ncbi:hypothetical protein ABT224_16320 [Streptomyces sp. NPDC001584]|uniref:hypothetical protein n=1 Tax=Streptomyces sp. NPDC001584 TaxID=3154521 RepID=UPI003327B7BD